MNRRQFLHRAPAAGAAALTPEAAGAPGAAGHPQANETEVVIERPQQGRPHKGKVLVAIQPHADDISLFASGTVAKLVQEGYTGHLIRVTNDDMAGPGTIGETVLANEKDNDAVARVLGLKRVFNLNYNNHRLDDISVVELRSRLIFLFRLLQADTVVCYDPWGHYEENPDHYVMARAIESACWMAGMNKDYPEHFAAGLKPKSVRERYYFARGPQLVNRVVDISKTVGTKIDCIVANKAQGPGGDNGARLRRRLAAKGLRLPELGGDDETANREYVRLFLLEANRELGRRYGLEYAEAFHYIGPKESPVEGYVAKHAVRL